ncbi:MAG TPA: efflux RND transporter periplasmic adaptor subunit [Dissulfurispiraceae bacterium]|nr:efflux RND transporter periplasmic adaptor subunit [Dissulfurispiraceae bacterium]
MKKNLIIAGAIALVLALIAGIYFMSGKKSDVTYKTEKAARGDVVESVTASGTVNAVTTVLVGTQVSGTIKQLYVDYNSKVTKGQLLAQIDPLLLEAQVDQARANLLKLQANTLDAQRQRDRNKQLFERNLIARSDYETSDANYDSFAAQVAAANASLRSAQTNLQYTRILSPVDGVVISRSVDVGQTVAASFQTPTLFTIAQDLTKMQVETSVSEADIGKIQVGQNVEFTVDAYPDLTFNGSVFQVRNAPVTVQNVVTYTVVVKVENPDLKLKPGMTANAAITTNIKKDVLRIPNAALRVRIADKGAPKQAQRGPGIWILEGETPKRIKITTGITDGTYTEMKSGELAENASIIVEAVSKDKKPAASGATPPAGGPRTPRVN